VALFAFLMGIAFVGGAIFASSNYWLDQILGADKTTPEIDTSIPPGVEPGTIASIVEQAGPAVVKIETFVSTNQRSNPFFNDPFFRDFFGQLVLVLSFPRMAISLPMSM